jgi:hypothetical protein
MAKAIRITQDSARDLKSAAICCSPRLRKTNQAVGGTLSLVAEFPDREPVVLAGILVHILVPRIGFTRDQEFSSAVNLQDK